jgi:23S rRNA (adenine2030-N6)-methyltransferase
MTYTHFGKQADVLKHLLLCELLRIEKPRVYVETNAACAQYALERTPEQEYGIYHFLKRVGVAEKEYIPERAEYHHPKGVLRRSAYYQSTYYQQESEAMQANRYIGWGFTVVQSSSEEQPDRAIAQAITANINFFILLLF